MQITVYDATLREGAQSAGTSFSLDDKLKLVDLLDRLGVAYIEAGNPGSNAKDAALFARMQHKKLRHATLAAFGSTARVGRPPDQDANLAALLSAETPAVAIFGKSWDFHVGAVLHCSLEDNLQLIESSVAFLKSKGREVIYDAEHFFDGWKHNPEYALQTIEAAQRGGADWICLCDTNGGCLPHEIRAGVDQAFDYAHERFDHEMRLGIHTHDDSGLAIANSIEAVRAGATMAQCTLNGWGERCGNANLFSLVGNLQLKMGCRCLEDDALKQFLPASLFASEVANRSPDKRAPFVGRDAFAHKAGMHIDAVKKAPETFEHIPPESVGNERRILISEVSGRSGVLDKLTAFVPGIAKDSPEVVQIVDMLKEKEAIGYQFEVAEASFQLLVRRKLAMHKPFFDVREFKVVATTPAEPMHTATVMVRVQVGGVEEITAADGDGPVNALDLALRKALERFFPSLKRMRLSDFKVRVLNSKDTASSVRVLIESTDGESVWTTVGVHADILQASFFALYDSLEYKLLLDHNRFEAERATRNRDSSSHLDPK